MHRARMARDWPRSSTASAPMMLHALTRAAVLARARRHRPRPGTSTSCAPSCRRWSREKFGAARRRSSSDKYYFDELQRLVLRRRRAQGRHGPVDAAATGRSSTASSSTARRALVGWFAGVARSIQTGLRLPLRVHDDHRRVRAAHAASLVLRAEPLDDARMPSCSPRHLGADRRRPRGARRRQRPQPARPRAGSRSSARSLGFLVTHPALDRLRAARPAMQFVELAPWIPRFNINYHLGVDGISVLFILLNSFITVLVVIARLGGDHREGRAVHGGVPDPVGAHQRRVRRARRDRCSTCSSRRC